MKLDTIGQWHALVRSRDMTGLDALLADNVTFHSPVVHTPQVGRDITRKYLEAALQVLNTTHFRYLREVIGERDAMLEFETEIDGIRVNGVDLIHWDDEGRITDFKVMVRPLKAIQQVHQAMGAMLQRMGSS